MPEHLASETKKSEPLPDGSGSGARSPGGVIFDAASKHPLCFLALAGISALASFFIHPFLLQDGAVTGALILCFSGGAIFSLALVGWKLKSFESSAEIATAADHLRGEKPPKTGVPILDRHIEQLARKILSLLEIIDSVQSNSDNILERYRIVTENIAASIQVRDLNGKLVYANPYTEVLTGYPLKDAYEDKEDFFSKLVMEDDREKYQRSLKITAMGEGFNLIYRALHKTGMEMWFETRTEPVLDDEGEVMAFLSVTMDITRLMRYQRQVEEKNRDLQDFTYMVSHDLKAPIVTVKGMLGLLEEDLKGRVAGEESETFEHIRLAMSRLDQLVASVLQYSRISASETAQEDVRLGDVFKDIINDYSAQIKLGGAELVISEKVNSATVNADRLKLYQIFGNLIGNAIKFKHASRPAKVLVETVPTKIPREILIKVSDNGIGVPADKLDSIFRPFHRAHGKAYEGTGIGLACVKRLLEKIGGTVRVESIENEGSSFFVSLKVPAGFPSISQMPL